ncbi:LodA/GoxA family CTQ-dependent oxidase [Roseivirga sp. E12]|uniref:LodA/GoxA family CTQ-dependent oxidase n=1 Tax=Roseivirga sp. E12 TaxID=2819237 RepID=UPI001ABC9707|nr:LodA/GoxA family CTQ-dependent oxidase [Roseivirga sp. E12]MBO3698399.1 LodA/GoxA family CTQ-dependent oxidase [Roseivirga sp. E12]
MSKYEIHPKLGVSRLGNSPEEFYLSPDKIGGLPIVCDRNGNAKTEKGKPVLEREFKDSLGRVKRQAAKFRIFKTTGRSKKEVTLSDKDVKSIEWTAHIANKKPIWYTFSELLGDLEFGEENSYENQKVPFNNPDVVKPEERKKLIIDPGPRSISKPKEIVEFSRYNIPSNYPNGSFPPLSAGGSQIDSLGELRMDNDGNLVAMGGFGNVTGSAQIDSFRGASGYWDDIADGYVTATIHLKDGSTIDAEPSWLMVGSPKYAPELVNITTLYDTAYNVGIRHMNADKDIYRKEDDNAKQFLNIINKFRKSLGEKPLNFTPLGGYQPDFKVNFDEHIKPILDRIDNYKWVADIPYLSSFVNPNFDLRDSSNANYENRMAFFNYFRVPLPPEDYTKLKKKRAKDLEKSGKQSSSEPLIVNGPSQLFSENGLPLMPLNSGDNSVTNSGPIYKFETLSSTQYFFLFQWAVGKFSTNRLKPKALHEALTEADMGNCVGAPFSPGIETTWIVRNAPIYERPMMIKLAHFEGSNSELEVFYQEYGLSTIADEAKGLGCEPGDLTKRMAIPWQSDFAECTVQTPNITNANINQFADGTGVEVPPAYYVYWWPPQSPMHVTAGSIDPGDQVLDGLVYGPVVDQPIIPAGQRVPYQRGVLNAADMINNWSRLGFIVNQGTEQLPYFTEKERNSAAFGQLEANQKGAQVLIQTSK